MMTPIVSEDVWEGAGVECSGVLFLAVYSQYLLVDSDEVTV